MPYSYLGRPQPPKDSFRNYLGHVPHLQDDFQIRLLHHNLSQQQRQHLEYSYQMRLRSMQPSHQFQTLRQNFLLEKHLIWDHTHWLHSRTAGGRRSQMRPVHHHKFHRGTWSTPRNPPHLSRRIHEGLFYHLANLLQPPPHQQHHPLPLQPPLFPQKPCHSRHLHSHKILQVLQ